jgi:phosphoribosyl-dephospho-CoA transferase
LQKQNWACHKTNQNRKYKLVSITHVQWGKICLAPVLQKISSLNIESVGDLIQKQNLSSANSKW